MAQPRDIHGLQKFVVQRHPSLLAADFGETAEVVGITELEPKGGRYRVRIDFAGDDNGVADLNTRITRANIAILGFAEETKDLEAMFMRVTKGIVS